MRRPVEQAVLNVTPEQQRQLFRRWLRGKQIHPQDIATTMTWLEAEHAAGKRPNSKEVMAFAEQCHARVVEQYRTGVTPPQIVNQYVLSGKWSCAIWAGLGALIGTWDSETTQSLLSLMDFVIQQVRSLNGW